LTYLGGGIIEPLGRIGAEELKRVQYLLPEPIAAHYIWQIERPWIAYGIAAALIVLKGVVAPAPIIVVMALPADKTAIVNMG